MSRGSVPRVRRADGSAGDVDYHVIGSGYSDYRRPDPEIAAVLHDALGAATTVLNVGAGAGSYEPTDRQVTAVEPAASMRAQRPADRPPALDATAEDLPFADGAFDAAMAVQTVHQWTDLARGLAELRRVTRGPVAVLTSDPVLLPRFWLNRYAPEAIDVEARRDPPLDAITAGLGGRCTVTPVPIPLHCVDGFCEAYYGRPERLLDPGARRAMSTWTFVPPAVHERFEHDLGRDLAEGRWDADHGHLRTQAHFLGSLVMVVSHRP
ncbi:methyltransferase domain-containing protein [Pseudonocardia xinjiangensis]|uniref:Methyltransferase domain-containing protein n=1 Tax=Pseudonocardia xinjiangensis TaxID=75289 RepID=A0ABX1R863_9PSEU|nr:methyltransferase domain-containing protein [Pseudonocardia xinjiangensis]